MKKGLASLVALVLAVCLAFPPWAAGAPSGESVKVMAGDAPAGSDSGQGVRVSREKAVEIVKGLFKVPEDLRFDVYLNTDWQPGNRKVWSVNFYRPYSSIYAAVDASSGEVISFSKNAEWPTPYGRRKAFPAKYTREEAMVFAENFIRKAAPDKVSKVEPATEGYYYGPKYAGIFEPASYFFRFKKAGGIQMLDYFGEEGINVTVDAVSGDITGYNLIWQDEEPLKEKIITLKEAQDIYKKYLGPELAYVRGFDETSGRPCDTARLVYVPGRQFFTWPPAVIRAKDGVLIDYGGTEVKEIEPISEPDPSGAKTVAPEFLKSPISMNEAQKIAEKELQKFGLENLTLQPFSEAGAPNPENLYVFYFYSKEGGATNANVTVNAATGKIQGFGYWKNAGRLPADNEKSITWEDAKNKAVDFLKKYLPDKAGQVRLISYKPGENAMNFRAPDTVYSFNFIRLVNGIPYTSNIIGISIDFKGEVAGFNYGWDEIVFPAPEKNIISREKAADVLFKEAGLALSYIMPKMYGYAGRELSQNSSEKILVYALKQTSGISYIDPYTGKPLNYVFKEPSPSTPPSESVRIKGETGSREAKLLLDQGIFDPAIKTIELEKEATLKDAVKFFALCMGIGPEEPPYMPEGAGKGSQPAEPDKRYINAAVRHGLITGDEAKSLDRPLTREELAKLAVRFLGYGPLAEKGRVFKLDAADAADVEEGYEGFAASSLALGIMEKLQDKFMPKEKVTFGSMIKTIYRAAELLQ
ncbi:YcdB/YcdC domain-containing protein [Thermoanaerobacterium sp. DL9XJH110]|uniref:YcdB/YcdC domain-containing protein n=1 Tax=Thermoanaerobacterium sp. DL9XJH110 TaxID=3386643 RepID=UPI003BB49E92